MSNDENTGQPAPSPRDLQESMQQIPEGPAGDFSAGEVEAARGETPLLGPRAGDSKSDENAERNKKPKYDEST